MKPKAIELQDFMAANKLTVQEVSELLDRKPGTVRVWRCLTSGKAIPDHAMELLRVKAQRLRATKDVAADRVEVPVKDWSARA